MQVTMLESCLGADDPVDVVRNRLSLLKVCVSGYASWKGGNYGDV